MTKRLGVIVLVAILLLGSQAVGRRGNEPEERLRLSYPAGSDYVYELDSRWVVGEAVVHSYGRRDSAWLLRLRIEGLGEATFALAADGAVRDLHFPAHTPASARFVLAEVARGLDVRDGHGVVLDARGHVRRAANADLQLRLQRIRRP